MTREPSRPSNVFPFDPNRPRAQRPPIGPLAERLLELGEIEPTAIEAVRLFVENKLAQPRAPIDDGLRDDLRRMAQLDRTGLQVVRTYITERLAKLRDAADDGDGKAGA